jgi:two-component sensor histidine kinase
VKTALLEAAARVMAVAQVHRRLYTSEDVKTVAIDQYLNALVEDLRNSTKGDSFAQLSLTADPGETDPDRAVAIGVIVNELVINACKYAYPIGKGPIRVRLETKNEGTNAVISVEDDGVGFAVSAPVGSTGLGQRIVKAMADKLGAHISHDRLHRGTRIEIAFALQPNTRPA